MPARSTYDDGHRVLPNPQHTSSAIRMDLCLHVPDWFSHALASPVDDRFADINGARLHFRRWGRMDHGKPCLLFLHGYRGHSRWWDFIAPFFSDAFVVVALDFSGMGDSEHRPSYSKKTFIGDIDGIISAAGLREVTAVGHSFGGIQLMRASAATRGRLRRAIIVDSPVWFRDEPEAARSTRYIHTTYPTIDAALTRFRLVPEQPINLPYTVDHVARHSLCRVGKGWRWKFDANLPGSRPQEDWESLLGSIDIPVDYLVAEHSQAVDRAKAGRIASHLRFCRGPIIVPGAHHHIMLDQPLALISTLRALLA